MNFKNYLTEHKLIKIGFIGYSPQKFDKEKATKILIKIFKELEDKYLTAEIVSGLTNMGIPGMVYKIAKREDYKTTGIACSRANSYVCFPVDKKIIVGNNWGDESDTFLEYIDILYKIGGGHQSDIEFQKAKEMNIPTYEYKL